MSVDGLVSNVEGYVMGITKIGVIRRGTSLVSLREMVVALEDVVAAEDWPTSLVASGLIKDTIRGREK